MASTPSPLVLPSELVYTIVRLAASLDPATAQTLAYVSHTVCRWTIAERWRTIVCTSPQQVVKLWLFLLDVEDNASDDATPSAAVRQGKPQGEEDEVAPGPSRPRRRRYLSCAPDRPGRLTRNLFLDTAREDEPPSLPSGRGGQRDVPDGTSDLLSLATHHQAQRERHALAEAARLARVQTDPPPAWETLQRLKLAPTRPAARLSGLLLHFPDLHLLSLGPAEMQLFQPSLASVAPYEMVLVYDGNDSTFQEVFLSGVEERCEWIGTSQRGESRATAKGNGKRTTRVATLGGIRRRLKRLHVVGIDPRSTLAGVAMPVKILEPLRSGSTAPGSLVHALSYGFPPLSTDSDDPAHLAEHDDDDDAVGPAARSATAVQPNGDDRLAPDETSQGLTHLRYDTRKFSFRPSEITAVRLGPFVQELSVRTHATSASPSSSTTPSTEGDGSIPADTGPAYTYTGARHAAPTPAHSAPSPALPLPDDTHPSLLLTSWGASQLTHLHLCWDTLPRGAPTPSAAPHEDPTNPSWPTEHRDVWTHHPSNGFAPELTESLSSLYGWHAKSARQRWFANEGEYVPRIETRGLHPDDPSRLDRIRTRFDAELRRSAARDPAREARRTHRDPGTLAFRARPPAEFIKLGESLAALVKEQRIALFLDRCAGGAGSWA